MRIDREQFLTDLIESEMSRKSAAMRVGKYILDLDARFSSGIGLQSLVLNLQMSEVGVKKALSSLKKLGLICYRKSISKYYVGPRYHESFFDKYEQDKSIIFKQDKGKTFRENKVKETGFKIWVKGQNKYA